MPMYNLIEYSDSYQDSSATLYQYKRDEPPEVDPIDDLMVNNSDSFKYCCCSCSCCWWSY